MKKSVFQFLLVFLILGTSLSANAWGVTGHRVVGEVASKHLTEKTSKKIKEILGNQTLAEVANWMDDIKSDRKYDTLGIWHYVSVPDGVKYEDSNINPKGDVIQGIEYMVRQLKKGGLEKEIEEMYIKMLVHFVGDLHQPLHAGRVKDRGGNYINVTWFGSRSNLHQVWDSDMLDSKMYSYTELTALINHPTKDEVKTWQSTDARAWLVECMDLRPQIYDFDLTKKNWEYSYMYANWDTVRHQLLKGGVRLAGLLNEIYG